MIKQIAKNIIPITLVTIYILISFVFQRTFADQNPLFPYVLEAIWVVLVLLILREGISFNFKFSKLFILEILILAFLGFALCRLTYYLNLPVPINKNDPHSLLFILIIAPILEELVFRKGLFISIKKIINRNWGVVILTSLMFSYSHFQYFFSTGYIFKNFIIYQSVYTFVIGLWFGYRILRLNSVGATIIMHLFLNAGFLLGLFTL